MGNAPSPTLLRNPAAKLASPGVSKPTTTHTHTLKGHNQALYQGQLPLLLRMVQNRSEFIQAVRSHSKAF